MLIILIVFGVGKLPNVAADLGKGIREFRKASRDDYDEESTKSRSKMPTMRPTPILSNYLR